MSDKIKLCKWDPIHIGFGEMPNPSNEAVMCTLSKFPETNTVIFKADPLNTNADIDLLILLKDDPEIMPDKTTEAKRGYSSTIIIISKIMIKELWVYLNRRNIFFTSILILFRRMFWRFWRSTMDH